MSKTLVHSIENTDFIYRTLDFYYGQLHKTEQNDNTHKSSSKHFININDSLKNTCEMCISEI